MKSVLLIVVLLFSAVVASGQARNAERIVDTPHSLLNQGNPPNGHVRHVINGTPGTSPCAAGGTGAMAIKVNGIWHCPSLTPGVGTGDMLGPSASNVGELMVYSGTSGKNAGRSNTLSGIPLLTNGVVTTLASSGTGNVVRSTAPTLTGPTLLTPTINSFTEAQHTHETANEGGQLNASNIFSGGTVPPARVITGAIVNSRCLRTSNVGQIEVAAADCGAGGGGIPGGVSGNLQVNAAGVFGGAANTAHNSVTGTLTILQNADGNDTLVSRRATDTSPTGTFLRLRNTADTSDLFRINANGTLELTSTVTSTNVAAPATPAAGKTVLWTDSTGKNFRAQDDAGNVSVTVRAIACSGNDKISSITSAGVVTCTPDQGGSGTGVLVLNGLNASDQDFVMVDDANIDLSVSSAVSTHTFTVAWVGILAKARQHAATVYSDQANTWSTGAQSFAAATSLIVPLTAGAAPTASGSLAADTTSNTLEYGENGTNRIVANTAGAQTFSNKTLDNSVTANLRDTLFTLQDNGDSTKTVNFELSGVTTGTNRVVTIANAASVTVQSSTLTANQFVTHIDSAGVAQKAQPSFANLSGSITAVQGGTAQTAVAQGDLLYGDATNSWARLPKNASATRYLSNTGASNNPAWAQVDASNGITGVLPVVNWSVLTTKGDLLVHNGTTSIRQAVGTNGQVLTADSTVTNGVRWATVAGSGDMVLASVQTVTGAKTFDPGKLIIGNVSAAPTPVLGSLYVDTDDGKLYFGIDSTNHGEVFVSGVSVVNLASANVSGILPAANILATVTNSRCLRVNSSGVIEVAAADCGAGGGSGDVVGPASATDNAIARYDSTTGKLLQNSVVTIADTTGDISSPGSISLTGSGAGHMEYGEGTAPTVVANRLTLTAPADVIASGYVMVLPSDTPVNGEQLTASISGTTITMSWDAAGGGGGGAPTDATYITQTANAGLSAEQALSGLSSGIMRVATTTGVITSLTTSADIAANISNETGTGVMVFSGSPTIDFLTVTGAVTWDDNLRQTFNPGAAQAGLNVGSQAGDPSTPINGDIWYDSTAEELTARINGANVALGAGGGGGANTALSNLAAVAINTSLVSDTDNTDDLGSGTVRWRDFYGVTLRAGSADTNALTLQARDVDGAAWTTFLTLTSGNTPTADLAAGVTIGGTAIVRGSGTGNQVAYFDGTGSAITSEAGMTYIPGNDQLVVGTMLASTMALYDTGLDHVLLLAAGSNFTANRTFTITTGDAARTLNMSGNITTAADFITSGANSLTLTTTGATNVTFPTSGTVMTVDSVASPTNKSWDTAATGNTLTSSHKVFLGAAGCTNTTAASFWDLPTTTPAVAACSTGTNVQTGTLDFADTSGGFTAQTSFQLPEDLTGTVDATITWKSTTTSGNAVWQIATSCTNTDATEVDDNAFNAYQTVTTAAAGVASRVQSSTITSVTLTGCSAGDILHLSVKRDGNHASDSMTGATLRMAGLLLTLRRAQ